MHNPYNDNSQNETYNNSYNPSYGNPPPAGNGGSGGQGAVIGGRYELLEQVGAGSMSHVYRGRDRVLDRIVAIKLLREEYSSDPNFVTRFSREAHAVASLSAINLVNIYDYGQSGDTYFIVMQYIDGPNLKQILTRRGPLPPEQAVNITIQVLQALKVAHAHGIIHRDVKPPNILIEPEDNLVKLTDFGVAHAADNSGLTSAGLAIGTAYYMAPEQVRGGTVSPATDLYAVGVVLYEILSGQLPFQGNNLTSVMYQQLNSSPPAFATVGAEVPLPLETVVQRALEKDPEYRYQNAGEMQAALREALTVSTNLQQSYARPNRQVVPSAPASVRRSSRRLWLVPLALLLIVGLIWLSIAYLSKPTNLTSTNQTNTVAASKTAATPVSINVTIKASDLKNAYQRTDGTLYGRLEVALYGAGSGYEQGTTIFSLSAPPTANTTLTITGLDDERAAHCHLQILLNGQIIFDGDDTFPNVAANDNGVGGADRYWGQMTVTVPANQLKAGSNSLTLRNVTPWSGQLGIPYILINSIALTS